MLKIAIVEDFYPDYEHLQNLLEQYCSDKNISADIHRFSSGEEFLEAFAPGQYHCVFLDIYLEKTDGMEIAKEIYQLDPDCRLIFSTISTSHAIASYEVRAAWYLTKPVIFEKLSAAMDVACAFHLQNDRMLAVHINGTKVDVKFDEIYYVDCINRQAKLHLREQSLDVDETIHALLNRLSSDPRYLLCNRNIMINMEHVELLEQNDFRMKNGVLVPLRQRGRTTLKKAYLDWSLRELRKDN